MLNSPIQQNTIKEQFELLEQDENNAKVQLAQDYDQNQLAQLSFHQYSLYKNYEDNNQISLDNQAELEILIEELKQQQEKVLQLKNIKNKFENELQQSQNNQIEEIASLKQQKDEIQQQLFSVQKQFDEQKKTIDLQENEINQFQLHIDALRNINKKQWDKIQAKNDFEIQLIQKVEDMSNEMQKMQLKNQIKLAFDNLLKIDENQYYSKEKIQNRSLYMDDILTPIQQQKKTPFGKRQIQGFQSIDDKINDNYQQFKEKIQKINTDRDKIIRDMEDILKQFEQIKSKNGLRQNQSNQQIDQNAYQNIKNKIKGSQQIIEYMEVVLDKFLNEQNQNLKNPKNEDNKLIQELIQKLERNKEFFKSVKILLNEVAKMLDLILDLKFYQNKENEELQKQLERLEKENNKIKDKFQVQINQLDEWNQQEQKLISDCLEISNKYTNLYHRFQNSVILEINKILQMSFKLFLEENSSQNLKQIKDRQSLIKTLGDFKLHYGSDSLEQQWEKIMDQITKIYRQISNSSFVNQYIYQTFQIIQEIVKKISQFYKDVDMIRQKIENSEKNARNE